MFPVEAQRLAAGSQHGYPGAVRQRGMEQLGDAGEDVFAVVKQQQHGAAAQVFDKPGGDRGVGPALHAEGGGDQVRDRGRVGDPGELTDPHPVRVGVVHVGGHPQRQSALARPAGTGERDQARAGERGLCAGRVLDDGAAGVRMVKRRGGRVLIQDPATARGGGMPAHAIGTGCVDFVLPLELIAPAPGRTMAPGGAELLSVPVAPWAQLPD